MLLRVTQNRNYSLESFSSPSDMATFITASAFALPSLTDGLHPKLYEVFRYYRLGNMSRSIGYKKRRLRPGRTSDIQG